MSLHSLAGLGSGGAGLADALPKILKELQGLKFSVLSGAASNTKIDVAALRPEDTILMALQLADAGAATDRTASTTIAPVKATGTLTIATAVNGNTATVRGVVYTFRTTPTPGVLTDVALGGSNAANAANLAAAINYYESRQNAGAQVVASANAAVVTITAVAEGTGGNSIALVGTASTITASGATLAGGTSTGGILISAATTSSKVLLVWFDKA